MDQWYERADHFLRDQEISAMDQNEIFVISGEQITSMAYELCLRADLAGRIRSSCGGKNPLIALKPNLVGPIPASDGATTHPQIVEGVIRYLRSEGLQNLVLMESSWVGDKTEDALLVTGFGELSRKLGVPFRDLQADRSVPVDCAGMKLNVCRKALEADFLINLPVMKGHCQTRMTCALKNMKGCIPGSEKRRFHRMGLHEPIGHLSAGLKQGFILADAICPDLTFEDGGNPVTLNTLLCAVDPVLLDAYACRLIGLKEESVPYIRIASECGVGKRDLSAAKVTHFLEKRENGEVLYTQGDPSVSAWKGDYSQILKVKELVCEMDSCSACYGTLVPILHRLEEEGLLKNLPGRLCIGQGFRGKKGAYGIGSCTLGFAHSLPGCPPSSDDIEAFLRSICSGPDRG